MPPTIIPKRTDGYFIVHPDKRFMPKATINQWYRDAVATRKVKPLDHSRADDMSAQAEALANAGLITLRGKST